MFITINMGLTAWDLGGDAYTHGQLSSNFQLVDNHDHTLNHGVPIPTGGLRDQAVSTAKIADNAVSGSKIQDLAITLGKLADNSVGSTKLIDGAVGTTKIVNGAVTPAKLDPRLMWPGMVVMGIVPPPVGIWELCDGRPWSSVPNDLGLTTGNLPNLINSYPLGANTTGTGSGPTSPPAVGQQVGSHSRDLTHSHTSPAHAHPHTHTVPHSHTVNPHSHGISADGDHNHGMHSRQNVYTQSGNLLQSLYVAGFNTGNSDAVVPNSGSHTHGGTTGSSGSSTSTDAPATTSDATSATATVNATSLGGDMRPASTGVLFFILVRLS